MSTTSDINFVNSFISKIYRKITQVLTFWVCLVVALQPMMVELAYAQEIIIDPNGNVGFAPTLQRASRPQVVDIAKPNSGGVSHNQYERFDVTSRGVVLNNSQDAVSTEIAGTISGNANLTDGTAATIVNEVTSTRASVLNGSIEVGGDRASVILANPNGITCSGCNFINATNGTLSTGTPVIDGGNVRLDVTQGTITIGRRGLAAADNNVSNINIIGRTVVVNGKVTAIDGINVQGGAQSYDLTNQRRKSTLVGTGDAPDFVVDGSEYGAMEAGRIQIIGNESGLGVRALGAIQSTTNDVRIIGDGDTTVRSVAAQSQVQIKSNYGDLTLERDITSATSNVYVYARHDLNTTDRTGLYGFTGVHAKARNGTLTFGGDIQSGADVILDGERELAFSGYGYASGDFQLKSGKAITIEGATIVANSVNSNNGTNIFRLNDSAVFSTQDFTISTIEFQLGKDVVVEGRSTDTTSNLVVEASGDFRNSADLRLHDAATINYAGNLYNETTGIIEEAKINIASTQEIHNAGVLYGTKSIDLDVAQLFNNKTGAILSKSIDINTTGLLNNEGIISSDGNLYLNSDSTITNDGYIQADRAYLTALQIDNTNTGELRVLNKGQVTAIESFSNDGVIASLGSFQVTADSFENKGVASVDTSIEVIATTITNRETLTAGGHITLKATDVITNLGTLASYGNASLTADQVDNQGSFLVDGVADIRSDWFVNKGEDAILRAKTGRIYSANIRNDGQIHLIDDFKRTNLNSFDNYGIFTSQGSIDLRGIDSTARAYFRDGSVLASGLQAGDAQVLLTGENTTIAFDSLLLAGRIAAGGTLKISGPSSLSVKGQLQAGQHVQLTAAKIDVGVDARITAGENAYLTATDRFTNQGVISLDGLLQLGKNSGDFINRNIIAASTTRLFALYQGNFENSGVFQTTGAASIIAANITNTGHIQSGGNLSLHAQQYVSETYLNSNDKELSRWVKTQLGDISGTGTSSSDGLTRLTGDRISFGDDTYISADLLHVTANNFHNEGAVALSGDGRSEWRIAETLHQSGVTYADGDIRIYTDEFVASEDSLLGSGKTLTVNVTDSASLKGRLSANNINLSAASISGTDTSSIIAATDIRLTATAGLKHYGEIASGDDLILKSENFDIRGNLFAKRVAITGDSRGSTRDNIYATETLDIKLTGTLHNYGLIEARDNLTTTSDRVINYVDAKISSTEIELNTTRDVKNSGEIFAASSVTLNNGRGFTNAAGASLTAVSFGLNSEEFRNDGLIDVYGFFGDVSGDANNYGTIKTQTYFGLEAGKLHNRANAIILSDGHLYIKTTDRELANYADAQIKGEVVDLRVASLSNYGLIQAQEVVNVADVAGDIINRAGGEIYGKSIALISSKNLINNGQIGRWWETETINLYGAKSVQNGNIVWGDEIRVSSIGKITNTETGNIKANDFLGVQSTANSVLNYGRLHGEAVVIDASADFLNENEIDGWTELFVNAGGTITNRDGDSTTAVIKGPTVNLTAGGRIDNNGTITGHNNLGITSENGRIYNNGTLSGDNIALIAHKGGVYLPSKISPTSSLSIEAQSISLQHDVQASDYVLLHSTLYDIEVLGVIKTNDLFVDAARNVKAAAQVFRGKNTTQIVANDIVRTDSNADNTKLGTISGASGDIYVRLRSGSLGNWANNDGTGNSYETVDWNVARSVALIADKGDLLLSGRIQADEDLVVQAKDGNVGIKDIRFDIGNALHLEADHYLKKNGWWNPYSAKRIQLIQNSGWFYTDDWLADTNIDYNLTVQAKTIIVNSSHRFVNKELILRASDDIRQWHSTISARELTYSAGNNIKITFNPFEWRSRNPGASETSSWWDVGNAGLRGHTLLSQKNLELYAGNDITLVSGKIHGSGDVSLAAGGDITSQPIYKDNTRGTSNGTSNLPEYVGWNFSDKYRNSGNWNPSVADNIDINTAGDQELANTVKSGTLSQIEEVRAYVNHIKANGDLNIYAGGYASFVGSNLVSQQGDIYIQAGQGINIGAAIGSREYAQDWSKKSRNFWRTKYQTWEVYQYDDIYTSSKLSAAQGSISLVSEGDILSAGANIESQGDLLIASAQRNLVLGTYAERYIRIGEYTKTRKTFGGLIKISDSKSEVSVEVTTNTGNDIRSDSQLTLKAENDIRIIGGRYQAGKVVLDAGRDLYIDGAIDNIRASVYSNKNNGITITTITAGFDTESVSLPEIISTEDPEFNIGGETHIAGWRGQDLNTSLLQTISNRDFDNALVNLYTPQDSANAASAAQDIEQKYLRDYDLPGASDGQQFAYLDTLIQDHGATYHTIQLRDHEWYDKQVQLNPAFQALLQVTVAYVTGGSGLGLFGSAGAVGTQSAFQIAAGQAFNSLTVSVIGGTITGEFDLGDALETAFIAGGTSFVSGSVTEALGLDTIPSSIGDAGGLQDYFQPNLIVGRLGKQVINSGISNVFNGEDFFEGIENIGQTFLVSETLALTQFGIGELGVGNENWEGSVGHILLHGGAGCVALAALDGECAAGFASGASSAVLAGSSSLSDEQKLELASLVGAIAAFPFADGEAVNVSFGGSIATSAILNNYLSHNDVDRIIEEFGQCFSEDDGCTDAELSKFHAEVSKTSAENDALVASCTTAECVNNLLSPKDPRDAPITDAGSMELYDALDVNLGDAASREVFKYLASDLEVSDDAHQQAAANIAVSNSIARNCDGDAACINQIREDVGTAIVGFIPGVGDGIDIYTCATNVSLAACTAAAVSLVPFAGDIAKLVIRKGGSDIAISTSRIDGQTTVTDVTPSPNATNNVPNGIWDRGQYTPIQRGNLIEDHLAVTEYSGWTRVGSQNNGFSPAFDFNQGSTWVSLKTVDTAGTGWQSSMRSHINELARWSSPTTPNSTRVLDIRVPQNGSTPAQSLIDYGASQGVVVRINEF